jgi:hypothetical protein
MTDAELESLRAAWAALPPSERPSGCSSTDDIWEAVAGHRTEEVVRGLLAHSVACADCSALWRLAHELAAAAGIPEAAAAEGSPRRPSPWPGRWVAGAAALAAAAVLAVALLPRLAGRHEPPVVRGAEAEMLRAAAGSRTLGRAHPVLRWTGAPEGSRYAVTVSTSDLTVLYRRSGLTVPELELPPGALSGVPPGGEVVWRVEAMLPDGRRMTSGAFLTRVE